MTAASKFAKDAAPPNLWADEPLLDGPLAEQIKAARAEMLAASQAVGYSNHPAHVERVTEAARELSDLLEQYGAQAADLVGLENSYRERRAELDAKALNIWEESDLLLTASKAYVQIRAAELARQRRDQELAEASGSSGSWEAADLTPYLSGDVPEVVPTVLRRQDGQALLYAGSNLLFGDSGTGKSLIMCTTVAQEIAAGRICVWLDYEEATPATTVARLLALGGSPEAVADQLVWLHPGTAATPETLAKVVSTARERAGDRVVSLVVVDSVGEALAVEGLNEDRDNEVGPWMNRMKTLTDQLSEAALVFIDHSTKAKDGAAKYFPSGSKRKRASITGAAWLVETVEEFAKGKAGALQLACAKDRHGHYKRTEVAALVKVTPAAGGLSVVVQAPVVGLAASADDLWPLVAQAVQACKKSPELLTKNDITTKWMTGGSNQRKRAAVDLAVQLGALSCIKEGQRSLHSFVRELTHDDSETVSAVAA